jgi:hypothetical protein
MTTQASTRGAGGVMFALPGAADWVDGGRVVDQMVRRASSLGFAAWWRRAENAGFCSAPIQLTGTDRFGRERSVWVRCNNRRASVCPSCSDLYARDTWQLVHAGCVGGHHDMAAGVASRPQVFVTVTAPSFGPVHSCSSGGERARVCQDHQQIGGFARCAHGKPLWCSKTHDRDDESVGEPLCRECNDYLGHVLFTWHLPELWRRFTIALRRRIAVTLRAAGVQADAVRVSFVKVVEMQRRAIPHIHALIRLDPSSTGPDTDSDRNYNGPAAARGGGEHDPDTGTGWVSPMTATELAAVIHSVARTVTFTVTAGTGEDHPNRVIAFGAQLDTQPLASKTPDTHNDSSGSPGESVPGCQIAGYLAKYVTKSLAQFGIALRRISPAAIGALRVSEHVRAILTTIAALAEHGVTGIGRWLHTLGYRGHITTKSRRYSTTMTALRAARTRWVRHHQANQFLSGAVLTNATAHKHDSPIQSETSVGDESMMWESARTGHVSPGDRILVVSAAQRRIESRRVGLIESRCSAWQESL